MWLFTPNAFFSVVEDYNNKKNLMVRARFKGDIEKVFKTVKNTTHTPQNDYPYRASIPKETVAQVVASNILRINYSNFKDEAQNVLGLHENKRLDALHEVWSVMVNAGDASAFNFKDFKINKKFKRKTFDFTDMGGYFKFRKR